MPITEKQKLARQNHIGASDMPAIMGFDPFRTSYDVYLEKCGMLEGDDGAGEAAEAGSLLEDGILKKAEQRLGKLTRNQYRSAGPILPLGAHCDAIVDETGEPVEAKTAGLFGPLSGDWGESDTDEVPDRVIIQATVQLICTDRDICHVQAFLGGRGFVYYRVIYDKEFGALVRREAVKFWEENVLKRIPPERSVPNLDVVKRVRRVPQSEVPVETKLVEDWLNAKDIKNAADKKLEDTQARLLAALGTAEGGRSELGLVTYLQQTRKAYSVPESSYRVLRLKTKGK